MVTYLDGAIGGLVATLVMVVAMMLFSDESPPLTACLWGHLTTNQGAEEYIPKGLLLHLVFGGLAGSLFVFIFTRSPIITPITTSIGLISWGIAWGLLILAIAASVSKRILDDTNADFDTLPTMAVTHAIYGLVLGCWIAFGGVLI